MNYPDDEDDDDPEWPDEADRDSDEEGLGETEPCPYCGRAVYEQAEVCPHCRSYISQEDGRRRKPLWMVVTVVVCVAIVVLFWVL